MIEIKFEQLVFDDSGAASVVRQMGGSSRPVWKTDTIFLDEKSITGVSSIESYKGGGAQFLVYFSGNSKTLSYRTRELAESWRNFITKR